MFLYSASKLSFDILIIIVNAKESDFNVQRIMDLKYGINTLQFRTLF
jgi:hypothetical protein